VAEHLSHIGSNGRGSREAQMSEQLYRTTDQYLASFIVYVLSEDSFARIEFDERRRPVVCLYDVSAGNSCSELAQMYRNGATLRDVRDFADCHRFVATEIRRAFRAAKK
jgi:hypothetical protein